jgi:hypothetical protein
MRSPRALALAVTIALALPAPITAAQPNPGPASGSAEPAPDFKRAGELYKAAEQAMADKRFDDAARDYGGAYEITRDSLLFFKIASAHDRAGRCAVAVTYYKRYLKEANPSPEFVKLAQSRIDACEGKVTTKPTVPSAVDAASVPEVAEPAPVTAAPVTAQGLLVPPAPRRVGAWIATGTAIGFVALGTVMALSASSTQSDLDALLATRNSNGNPPAFDGTTSARYNTLIQNGERYQTLSWISFGVAGAATAAAAYLFVSSRRSETSPLARTTLTPTIGRDFAAIATSIRF